MNKFDKWKKKTKWEPKISVIIPAYNEEDNIAKCIESVLNADYPKNKLEIIVVDDGSTDKTYEIALKYKKFGVKVFRKQNEGTAAATKNYGIKRTTGEIIATLDADSYISKDAIKKLLPLFEDKSVAAVTSAIKVSRKKNVLQKVQEVEYLLTLFSRRLLSFIDAVFVTPGPFSLFRASVFKQIGYFDEKSILEDQEIALRIQKHNLKIRSSMDAEVFTDVPETFRSLLKQRIRWHRGGLINSIKYLELISPKYGDFGLIVMPLSLLTVVLIFAVIGNTVLNMFFSFQAYSVILNGLFFFIQPVHIVEIVIFLITLGFTLYQFSFFKKEHINPGWVLIFIISYAYLITLYWILAIGKQIRGDKVSW